MNGQWVRAVGALEQVRAHVLERDAEARQDVALVQQRAARGVEHDLAGEARAHAPREGVQQEPVARALDRELVVSGGSQASGAPGK